MILFVCAQGGHGMARADGRLVGQLGALARLAALHALGAQPARTARGKCLLLFLCLIAY